MPGQFSKLLGLFTAQTRYRLLVGMLLYPTDCIFTTAVNPRARGSGDGGHRVLGWRGLCVLGEGDTAELPAHVSSGTRALCTTLFDGSVFFPSSAPFLPLSPVCVPSYTGQQVRSVHAISLQSHGAALGAHRGIEAWGFAPALPSRVAVVLGTSH